MEELIHWRAPSFAIWFAALAPVAGGAGGGGGGIGGRAVPCDWRWVSISLTSMAGATALTGIWPDSAPQMPLKTSCRLLVATMRASAACGVPTLLTDRTSTR